MLGCKKTSTPMRLVLLPELSEAQVCCLRAQTHVMHNEGLFPQTTSRRKRIFCSSAASPARWVAARQLSSRCAWLGSGAVSSIEATLKYYSGDANRYPQAQKQTGKPHIPLVLSQLIDGRSALLGDAATFSWWLLPQLRCFALEANLLSPFPEHQPEARSKPI